MAEPSPLRDRVPALLGLLAFLVTPAVLMCGPGAVVVFKPFVLVGPWLALFSVGCSALAFVLGAFAIHKARVAFLSVVGGVMALCAAGASISWAAYDDEVVDGVHWVVLDTGYFDSDGGGMATAWLYSCNAVQICTRCRSSRSYLYGLGEDDGSPSPGNPPDCE